MSYDIRFKAKLEGADVYVDVWDCHANITYNVGEMIRASTGLEWKNCENNGFCKDVIPFIRKGFEELSQNEAAYTQHNAPNGWGDTRSARSFFVRVLSEWDSFVLDRPEIAHLATFWIE